MMRRLEERAFNGTIKSELIMMTRMIIMVRLVVMMAMMMVMVMMTSPDTEKYLKVHIDEADEGKNSSS